MQAIATENDKKIQELIEPCVFNPLLFVQTFYTWGEGYLSNESGPEKWQIEALNLIGEQMLISDEPVQVAIASGRGPGKTAFTSWIIDWFVTTRIPSTTVVTSGTMTQLTTKTWRELAKWQEVFILKDWFEWTATRYYFKKYRKTCYASAIPWSKTNADTFQGTHELNSLYIFDEASTIDDVIWEKTEGGMTDPGVLWLVLGNRTQSTGRFYQCFNKYRKRWHCFEIDSREVKRTNKKKIQQWIEDYGIDSDFVRVNVLGLAPRAGSMQMIPSELAEKAKEKEYHISEYDYAPKVGGADIARFGDDEIVIYIRQGLKSLEMKFYRELDTMTTAGNIVSFINKYDLDMMFIDMGSFGAAVYDRVSQLGYQDRVMGINFGGKASRPEFADMATEMWQNAREWLELGGTLIDDNVLIEQLTSRQYGYDRTNRKKIEPKDDMKERMGSPDRADAFVLTHAMPVEKRKKYLFPQVQKKESFDPYEYA